jgi:hypothetical protein
MDRKHLTVVKVTRPYRFALEPAKATSLHSNIALTVLALGVIALVWVLLAWSTGRLPPPPKSPADLRMERELERERSRFLWEMPIPRR